VSSEIAATTASINIAHEFFVVIVSSFTLGDFVFLLPPRAISTLLSEVDAGMLQDILLGSAIACFVCLETLWGCDFLA
jgi:uncharacterized protein YqhQ